jgi:hypothetical protein
MVGCIGVSGLDAAKGFVVVAAIAVQWERPRVEMARVGIRERNNNGDATQGAFGSVALGFGNVPHALG